MKLRHHIGSILFVVAAVASGAYAALDAKRHGVKADEARVFGAFGRKTALRIELEHGGARLVLERPKMDAEFRMTSPTVTAVDPASVEQLLAAIEAATVAREVPDATFSNAPRLKGTLMWGIDGSGGTATTRFALAEPAPVPDGAAYVDLDGKRRVVVRRELVAELLRPFDAYRNRALLPIDDDGVATIEVRGATGTYSVERTADGAFRLPRGPRVARDLVDRWLNAVPELRATSFVRDPAPDGAPVLDLTFGAKSGERHNIRFFGPCPGDDREVLAVAPFAVACVAQKAVSAFALAPAVLADRQLFWARVDETSEITIDGSSSGLSLARVGAGFRERRPGARDLDAAESDAATALISRLLTSGGEVVSPPSIPEGGTPAIKVSVLRAGQEAPERVEIFDLPTGAFAHRMTDQTWLTMRTDTRRGFEPLAGGIRAPWLMPRSFSADNMTRLVVRCGTSLTLSKSETGFVVESPRGLPVDVARALDLIELLQRTRGRSVVSVPETTAQTCNVQVSWAQDGGVGDAAFSVIERPDARSQGDAGSTTNEPTFNEPSVIAVRAGEREGLVVGETLRAALGEPLVDRGALAWSGEGNPLLASLRASRVERVGPALPQEGFDKPLAAIKVAADGGALVTFRFVRARTPQTLLVRRSDLDVTFVVAEETLPRDLLPSAKP